MYVGMGVILHVFFTYVLYLCLQYRQPDIHRLVDILPVKKFISGSPVRSQ
jgi:hypothetical protein